MLEIQFTAENQFTTEDIFHIEEASALYLKELLNNETALNFLEEPDSLIDVSVNVEMQRVNGNEISLGSEVDVIHYGEVGISDMALLLTFLVNKNNTDSSFIYLDHIIKTNASVELISFDYVSESIAVVFNLTTTSESDELQNSQHSGNEKTLLVVTTLLSITLFGMSAILIWVGGGWLMLRKKMQVLLLREEELTRMTQNIQSKQTAETEDGDEENPDYSPSRESQTQFTNPSGILGVNNTYATGPSDRGPHSIYGLGLKTPAKLGDSSADDLATPMSVMSDYSDTDRAPIGIMSMRKLVPSFHHDEDEEDEDETIEGGFAGMKKLEY